MRTGIRRLAHVGDDVKRRVRQAGGILNIVDLTHLRRVAVGATIEAGRSGLAPAIAEIKRHTRCAYRRRGRNTHLERRIKGRTAGACGM